MRKDENIAVRQVVWQLRIPETVVDLYFRYIRALPTWKRDFPQYVHPDVRGAVQLGHNRTKVSTVNANYVFFLDERETLVVEAGERIRTGTLDLYWDDVLVLRLGISPADANHKGTASWVPRSVEEFTEGDWVEELLGLGPKLEAHEAEQKAQEQARHQSEVDAIAALQAKLDCVKAPEKRSWLPRWLRF
jgi:hypothetical protein